MDDSQSSDVFSQDVSYENDSPNMDGTTYHNLVESTKLLLVEEISKTSITDKLSRILLNCDTCICQSLDLATSLLADTDVQLHRICEFLDNVVCLLHKLCIFMEKVTAATTMTCSRMKLFPGTTGKIILSVFSYCKDSDSLYGKHLKNVESQLKSLFKTCHDLQVGYLMIMEKHFIFDLTQNDELQILIEALDINLKVGEIVQILDVKTMAEQWKACTTICEKYSNYLLNTHIYVSCCDTLCTMIGNNISSCLEVAQEEKIVIRSSKVTSFTIKILIKVCNIFKNSTVEKNNDQIVNLLIYIFRNNCTYLDKVLGKSPQFTALISNNVLMPAELLLKELLNDDNFVQCALNFQVDDSKMEDKLVGHLNLLLCIMKIGLRNDREIKIPKQSLLESIFKFLPYGHIWFNIGLQIPSVSPDTDYNTVGFCENLLTYCLAYAMTLDADEANFLERKMYESILRTDYCSAVFSSNLWILMAKCSNRHYVLSQLVSLCKVYKRLDENYTFRKSPQHIHFSYTISGLFGVLQAEDKMAIYKMFKINEPSNLRLWTALQIANLPVNVQNYACDLVQDKLETGFGKLFSGTADSEDVFNLINTMELAATCKSVSEMISIETIVNAWMRICPQNRKFVLGTELEKGSLWYFDFTRALAGLTTRIGKYDSCDLVKILHVVDGLLQNGTPELKLTMIELITYILSMKNLTSNKKAETLLLDSVRNIVQDPDKIVRNSFLIALKDHMPNTNIENVITIITKEDDALKHIWNDFVKDEKKIIDVKEQLMKTTNWKYCHKCVESANVIELTGSTATVSKSNSNNFDFADIDTLFDNESDSEPASKKAKPNESDVDQIITRLEANTTLLCNLKENIVSTQYNSRISKVCDLLRNIIE